MPSDNDGFPRRSTNETSARHNGTVADDDIERLLREINQGMGGQVPAPQPQPQRESGVPSRIVFTGVAAMGSAGVAWFFGLVLPLVSATSAGIGGAIGGGLVALIAGPPRWLSR
jgi:hypothetical protein